MYVDLTCTCAASFQMESSDEDQTWIVIHRFLLAHTSCGYVSGMEAQEFDSAPVRRLKFNRSEADDSPEEIA